MLCDAWNSLRDDAPARKLQPVCGLLAGQPWRILGFIMAAWHPDIQLPLSGCLPYKRARMAGAVRSNATRV